jgi:hypothetical protein
LTKLGVVYSSVYVPPNEPSEVLSVRVPRRLAERVDGAAARLGAPRNHVIEEALMLYLPDLSPEAFVLDTLSGYEAISIATRATEDGDVAEVTEAAPRREMLGRRLHRPRPIEELICVKARPERAGRTAIELVALPGDFAGVRIYIATVPAGVPLTLTVRIDDLQPGLRTETP